MELEKVKLLLIVHAEELHDVLVLGQQKLAVLRVKLDLLQGTQRCLKVRNEAVCLKLAQVPNVHVLVVTRCELVCDHRVPDHLTGGVLQSYSADLLCRVDIP